MKRTIVFLLSYPLAASGSICNKLVTNQIIHHYFSINELFRDELRQDTPLAKEIRSYLDRGEIVSNKLVSQLVFGKIKSTPGHELILVDRAARTIDLWTSYLAYAAGDYDLKLLLLELSKEELAKRVQALKIKHMPENDTGEADTKTEQRIATELAFLESFLALPELSVINVDSDRDSAYETVAEWFRNQ